jgi:hypothetical protein
MEDEDGKHLAEILRVLSEADAWAGRTNADASRLRPSARSSLRGDDDKAHPYDLSHAVWHALSHAVDHLGSLRTLLGDAKVIHMYAPFTLVRGALENACGAVWLLQPPNRKDRLTRRFRLAIADVGNGEKARHLTGQSAPRNAQDRIDEIHAIAARAGIDAPALKKPAGYTEIIRTVDADGPANSIIEASWRLCSGFAHGDLWTTLSASRRTQIPGAAEPGIGTFKIEANLGLLMQVTTLAVGITRHGWQLHDHRCLPPVRLVTAAPAANRS